MRLSEYRREFERKHPEAVEKVNRDLAFQSSRLAEKMRLMKGWTQLEMSWRVGTKQSSISRAEKYGCSLSFLQKISDATDIPIKLHL